MKAKEITQKNKDLDLRRWGKNVYSEASKGGRGSNVLSGYALWVVMVEYLRRYFAIQNTSLNPNYEIPIGYAIVPVYYGTTEDEPTVMSQAQEVHAIEEFSMEDVQKLFEYGENQSNAIAFFYDPNDLDGNPVIVGYGIVYVEDSPSDSFPSFYMSNLEESLYKLTKNNLTYIGYYGEITLK